MLLRSDDSGNTTEANVQALATRCWNCYLMEILSHHSHCMQSTVFNFHLDLIYYMANEVVEQEAKPRTGYSRRITLVGIRCNENRHLCFVRTLA